MLFNYKWRFAGLWTFSGGEKYNHVSEVPLKQKMALKALYRPAGVLSGWSVDPCTKKSSVDSWSGHEPGLLAQSLGGGMQEAAVWCFYPFLSLPLSLKNK